MRGITFDAWRRRVLDAIEPFNMDKFRSKIEPLGDGWDFDERISVLFDDAVFPEFIERFMSGGDDGRTGSRAYEFNKKFGEFIDRLPRRKHSIEKFADDPEWLEITALSNEAMAEIEALQDPEPGKEYT